MHFVELAAMNKIASSEIESRYTRICLGLRILTSCWSEATSNFKAFHTIDS